VYVEFNFFFILKSYIYNLYYRQGIISKCGDMKYIGRLPAVPADQKSIEFKKIKQ